MLQNHILIIGIGKNDKNQLRSDSFSLFFVATSVLAVLHQYFLRMILPITNLVDRANNSYVTQYICLSFLYLSLIFLFQLLFSSFLTCFYFLYLLNQYLTVFGIFTVFPFRSLDFQRKQTQRKQIHFDKIPRNHRHV